MTKTQVLTLTQNQNQNQSLDTETGAQSMALLAPNREESASLIVSPVSDSQAYAMVAAKPLPPPAEPRKIRRNGRIAMLPRLQRDMVNRMLWNSVPYKNIVTALSDDGFEVTDRNISNWATGGYLEWRLEQEAVLQTRLDQDHLLDFLRRDDGAELPEVGLQAAATRLSQVILQKLARADDPEANLGNFSHMVDLLCRLNREIGVTQKARDDSRRTLGREYDPIRVKDEDLVASIETERFYSNPPADSTLTKPSEPPFLPPIPTSTMMASQAKEDKEVALERTRAKNLQILKAFKARESAEESKTP